MPDGCRMRVEMSLYYFDDDDKEKASTSPLSSSHPTCPCVQTCPCPRVKHPARIPPHTKSPHHPPSPQLTPLPTPHPRPQVANTLLVASKATDFGGYAGPAAGLITLGALILVLAPPLAGSEE
jgi:hypothetical protein